MDFKTKVNFNQLLPWKIRKKYFGYLCFLYKV